MKIRISDLWYKVYDAAGLFAAVIVILLIVALVLGAVFFLSPLIIYWIWNAASGVLNLPELTYWQVFWGTLLLNVIGNLLFKNNITITKGDE